MKSKYNVEKYNHTYLKSICFNPYKSIWTHIWRKYVDADYITRQTFNYTEQCGFAQYIGHLKTQNWRESCFFFAKLLWVIRIFVFLVKIFRFSMKNDKFHVLHSHILDLEEINLATRMCCNFILISFV